MFVEQVFYSATLCLTIAYLLYIILTRYILYWTYDHNLMSHSIFKTFRLGHLCHI